MPCPFLVFTRAHVGAGVSAQERIQGRPIEGVGEAKSDRLWICRKALAIPRKVFNENAHPGFAPPVAAQFIESSRPAARVALRLKPTSRHKWRRQLSGRFT